MTSGHILMELIMARRNRQQRRLLIISAAAELIAEHNYADVSISKIAAHAGFAKGTVYNYFEVKEEIFIEIYKEELELWLDELTTLFKKNLPQSETLDKLVSKHCQRKLFIRLISLLNTVLEGNLPYESLKSFKEYLIVKMGQLARDLPTYVDWLSPDQVGSFMIHYMCHLIGLYHMGKRNEALTDILNQNSTLQILSPDLETELKVFVRMYFQI